MPCVRSCISGRTHWCPEGSLKPRRRGSRQQTTRAFYDTSDLLTQFKTYVWGLVEYKNGAFLHASPTIIPSLEKVQRQFVSELRITEEMTSVEHNFVSLCLRRAIGILGFLHKRVFGQCHPSVRMLLPFSGLPRTCLSKQIETHLDKVVCKQTLYFCSLSGFIAVYNRLPEGIVNISSGKAFQRALTTSVFFYKRSLEDGA